jgi:hypothetical protein
MTYFVWFMLGMGVLDVLGRLVRIAKDDYPQRSRVTECVNVFANAAIVVWAVYLIATQ